MRSKFLLIILGLLFFGSGAFAKIPVYRDYQQVANDLKKIASTYASITKLDTYGKTAENRDLYVLKISSGGPVAKRSVLITAATHGDELITTEVLFILLAELLDGYGKDPRLTQMIEKRDIYIIPVVSPDSFEARDRNIGGIDPNRSFPIPGKSAAPAVDVVAALVKYVDKIKFHGSLDLHAFGKLIMYPWSYSPSELPPADFKVFEALVANMSRGSAYKTGQISKLIHEAEGSSGDYFYWKNGTIAVSIEIGKEKIPHWSKFPEVTNEVREMIWSFIEFF